MGDGDQVVVTGTPGELQGAGAHDGVVDDHVQFTGATGSFTLLSATIARGRLYDAPLY